jgi:predicted DNA-binding transcriptional regulator YafY
MPTKQHTMPPISERLLFWDALLATGERFTPFELMQRFERKFTHAVSERTLKADLRQLKEKDKAPLKNKRFDNQNDTLKPTQKSHYFYTEDFTIAPMELTVEEINIIQQAVDVLKQFKHLSHLKDLEKVLFKIEHEANIKSNERQQRDIIAFEQVPQLRGLERLESLYRAIKDEKTLTLFYKPFDGVTGQVLLHPYFLKEFNNRWFVYGLNEDIGKILPFALDRIESVFDSKILFTPNQSINFDEFFKNRIGITYYEGDKVETVRLKVMQPRAQYILTKPWHESQKIEEEIPEKYVVFSFELVCNKELEAMILSFGKDVEVLEPPQLRTQIQEILTTALSAYK